MEVWYRSCTNCIHWQGNQHFDGFGMCNCVCAELEPRLWEMESLIPNKRFRIPFDPHDMKYFTPHPDIIRRLKTMDLPPEYIEREIVREDDLKLILNNHGEIVGERVAKANIIYFHTYAGNSCGYYDRGTF